WRGYAPWSPARRPGGWEPRLVASARRRSRRPPGRLPRRSRSRRGSRSTSPEHIPTAGGRSAQGWSPKPFGRAYLDRASQAGRRDLHGQFDGRAEVVGLKEVGAAADRLLDLDEGGRRWSAL